MGKKKKKSKSSLGQLSDAFFGVEESDPTPEETKFSSANGAPKLPEGTKPQLSGRQKRGVENYKSLLLQASRAGSLIKNKQNQNLAIDNPDEQIVMDFSKPLDPENNPLLTEQLSQTQIDTLVDATRKRQQSVRDRLRKPGRAQLLFPRK